MDTKSEISGVTNQTGAGSNLRPPSLIYPQGGSYPINMKSSDNFDFKTDAGKRKFAEANYQQLVDGGFTTKDLNYFLNKDGATVNFTRNGQIVIDGVSAKLPDFTENLKRDYRDRLQDIKNVICKEREALSNFSKVTTVLLWSVFILLVIVLFGYMFYRFITPSSEFD